MPVKRQVQRYKKNDRATTIAADTTTIGGITEGGRNKLKLKADLPRGYDVTSVVSRVDKNYIHDNVSVAMSLKPREFKEIQDPNFIHKNFGKTPKYIHKYNNQYEQERLR